MGNKVCMDLGRQNTAKGHNCYLHAHLLNGELTTQRIKNENCGCSHRIKGLIYAI